jgi:hypothetical protein
MSNLKTLSLALVIVGIIILAVRAQSTPVGGIQINTVTALSQCAQPTSGSSVTLICPMPAGLYVSSNGSAYAPIGSQFTMPANCPAGTVGPSGITFGANCK